MATIFRKLKDGIMKSWETPGNLGYKLHIHHIDYNKKNNNLSNLVSLCRQCHSQTLFGRENWTNYFKQKIG